MHKRQKSVGIGKLLKHNLFRLPQFTGGGHRCRSRPFIACIRICLFALVVSHFILLEQKTILKIRCTSLHLSVCGSILYLSVLFVHFRLNSTRQRTIQRVSIDAEAIKCNSGHFCGLFPSCQLYFPSNYAPQKRSFILI